MTKRLHSGFTIIETMLFLTVSALLTISVLVGVGSTIGQQRYRDSVNSLRSYIQKQYSLVANTSNDRSGVESCSAAVVSTGGAQPRGTSECVLLGRYVSSDAAGKVLQSVNVIASPLATPAVVANDTDDLKNNYIVTKSPLVSDTYDIAWDSHIVNESNPSVAKRFSLLIVRAPRSGSIITYGSAGSVLPKDLLTAANNRTPLVLCLKSDDMTTSGRGAAVRIKGFAANQGSVEVPAEKEGLCS
ncbi:MAG: hypothetical protein ABIR91_02980 [Candidatus Saccharimonadales bacterium]